MHREGWSNAVYQDAGGATVVDVSSMKHTAESKWSEKYGDRFWDIASAAVHLSLESFSLLSLWGCLQLLDV